MADVELQLTAVDYHHVFRFKKPRCPYCGDQLIATVNAWYADPKIALSEDFTWCSRSFRRGFNDWLGETFGYYPEKADEVQLDCMSDPDVESDKWEEWWQQHSDAPFDNWLPLQDQILAWINRRYVFVNGLTGASDPFRIPAASRAG